MFYFFIFFFLQSFGVVGSSGNVFGITNFTDIPVFLAGGPIRIDLMPYLPTDNVCEKKKIGINIVGQSLWSNNNDKIGQFFFPSGDLLLTVTGGPDYFVPGPLPSLNQPNNKVVRDIDALVLGINDSDFFSIISVIPESILKYIGLYGYYVFLFNDNNTPKLSFEVAIPIINIMHKTIGKENIYKKGDNYDNSPVKSALDGLSSNKLNYQRWNFTEYGMNKTIVPDIECNLSYNFLPISNCSIESYLGCLVPLRARCQKNCNNQYIFEPIFNNLEHFGLQYGTTISLFLYQNDERVIKFVFGNNLLYLFPGNEFRSFDLQGRPWSRYLYAYNNFQLKNQSLEPLVNFLSFECRVSPNFSNIATSELHYIKGNFNFAVGYSLFARQSESVTILEDLPNIVLQGTDLNTNILVCPPVSIIRDIGLRLSNEDVQTREIDFNSNDLYFNANYFYAKINNTMIDISSATHPAVFSGELYCKTKIYINEMFDFFLGSSYKFSHNNAAIEYITLWIGFQSCF